MKAESEIAFGVPATWLIFVVMIILLLLLGRGLEASWRFNQALVRGLHQHVEGEIPCDVISGLVEQGTVQFNTRILRAIIRLDGLTCVDEETASSVVAQSRRANDALLLFGLGRYFEHQGQMQDAVGFYRDAGVASILASDAYRRGVECGQAGDLSCQEAAWKRATLISPTPYFVEALVGLYLAHGRLDEAAVVFEEAARITDDPVFSHLARGRSLDIRKEYDAAVSELRQAAILAPDNVDAQYYLGLTLRKAGRFSEAKEVLLSVVERRPDAFWALVALGETYLNLGQWQDALYWYDKALSLRPKLASLHIGRGQALIKLGRMEEARAALTAALTIDPENVDARRLMEQVGSSK